MTNLQTAIAYINGEISIGKFRTTVTDPHDVIGCLTTIAHNVLDIHGQGKTLVECSVCRKLLILKRKPTHGKTTCSSGKCRKVAKLGKEKPVTLDSIPSNFSHSPLREINQYNGKPE